MLGLNFAHRGNGFSYLGFGARRLSLVSRARWLASFPNRVQLVHPLASLSSTLKERVEICLGDSAYLNGQLFFNGVTSDNLAKTNFGAGFLTNAQGALVPFREPADVPVPTAPTIQLGLFMRLTLLDAAGFYLFLALNVNPKFVLFAFVL